MKHKIKNVILAITLIILVLGILVFFNLPKPVATSNAAFDLSQIVDGRYLGSCDNGLVKVKAEVVVQNHKIVQVNIKEHNNGLGSSAEVITDVVVQQQSVELEVVSGATMSSKTILKAIENTLVIAQNAK